MSLTLEDELGSLEEFWESIGVNEVQRIHDYMAGAFEDGGGVIRDNPRAMQCDRDAFKRLKAYLKHKAEIGVYPAQSSGYVEYWRDAAAVERG